MTPRPRASMAASWFAPTVSVKLNGRKQNWNRANRSRVRCPGAKGFVGRRVRRASRGGGDDGGSLAVVSGRHYKDQEAVGGGRRSRERSKEAHR